MKYQGRFTAIALASLAADRITKVLAVRLPEKGMILIPGLLGLRYAENRGIAFSLLSGHPRLLGIFSLLILTAGFFLLRKKDLKPFPVSALALMGGGAAGNMIDRLWHGYVPDMIETLFVSFPIFNVADACLTAGCALMVISLLFRKKDWETEPAEENSEP